MPLPDHISARPEDLPRLIDGIVAFDQGAAPNLDAVIAAAIFAFGSVYIHPFEDGDGRIHRVSGMLLRHSSDFCIVYTPIRSAGPSRQRSKMCDKSRAKSCWGPLTPRCAGLNRVHPIHKLGSVEYWERREISGRSLTRSKQGLKP